MSPGKPTYSLRWVVLGYTLQVIAGWGLLSLPLCSTGHSPGPLNNLFNAISAVSTTGLTSVTIATNYSFWGHLVILLLIQSGGIGYMTMGSFVLLASRRELPDENEAVTKVVFDLPKDFSAKSFVRNVVVFTFVIEAIGFAGLWYRFAGIGIEDPAWHALFHAVSAFCTAGFSLFPENLERFSSDPATAALIATLSFIGATGFLVTSDFYAIVTGGRRRESLTTSVILIATAVVLVIGTTLFFFLEPAHRDLAIGDRFSASAFQTASALATVGFNTYPIDALGDVGTLLLLLLMIFGSSPSGTGGGIRITAVAAAASTMWTTIRQRTKVTLAHRRIPQHRITSAFVSIVFYIALTFFGALTLFSFQAGNFEDVLFEVVSAVSTTGLSRGITAELSNASKSIIMLLMFVGRVGPITVGAAAFAKDPDEPEEVDEPEEDLAVD